MCKVSLILRHVDEAMQVDLVIAKVTSHSTMILSASGLVGLFRCLFCRSVLLLNYPLCINLCSLLLPVEMCGWKGVPLGL